jgi:oligopeptide/dipeptide ABC transporter ATP-binding protein
MTDTTSSELMRGTTAELEPPLLEVDNVHVEFRLRAGVVKAVNGISYALNAGETLAILGESGCGKSIGAQAVMGIIASPPGYVTNGAVRYRGTDILKLSSRERRKLLGERLAMIYQSVSLNPSFTVGWQIAEMFRVHRGMSKREGIRRAIELLDRVGIPAAKDRVNDYPHQFSGGMRQRVTIAMAIALEPELLIADEPTTALDVTVQAQIMELLARLKAENGMALILITHDLGVVAEVADRVAVMYAGRMVESGPIREVYDHPRHPYTRALMRSAPSAGSKGSRLSALYGSPPDLMRLGAGCPFHPRCDAATERCVADSPPLYEIGHGRTSACFYAGEVADDI